MNIGTKLVCAAIMHRGQIYTGTRHASIQMTHTDKPLLRKGIQGFCTDAGHFLNREDAKKFAKSNGQLPESFDEVLTSEALW